MRDPAEAYFAELSAIRASGAGVAETSYYGALATLLTDVGSRLKPKVRAFMQLKNRGAGYPDGGLFEQKQYAHAHDAAPLEGQMPNRGAIEVKGTGDDVFDWSQWPDPTQVPPLRGALRPRPRRQPAGLRSGALGRREG